MIPFVQALGDELERAIAARRGRIRRRIVIGGLGFAIAATGVAAASGVFSTPEQLASLPVTCYEAPQAGVGILPAGDLSPVEACRRVIPKGRLVACRAPEHVAVLPGGPGECAKHGWEPLPAEYATARARVVELQREIEALDASADCVTMDEYGERAQGVLDRLGWTGWRVEVRKDLGNGPCGTALAFNGDGSRSIEGAISQEEHRLWVFPELPRSTIALLFGPDSPGVRVTNATGERCYTVEGIKELARRRFDQRLKFTTGALEPGVSLGDERGRRLAEGCAVIDAISAADDGRGIVVVILDER